MSAATLDVLNVGLGDLKLRWNPDDPSDVEKAQSTVEMLLKQGYAICVEKPDGRYARVKKFDRAADCYIVSEVVGHGENEGGASAEAGAEGGATKKRRGRPKKGSVVADRAYPRSKTRATAIGPSAGG